MIVPKRIDKKFKERKNVDFTVQSTLVNDDLFMTIQNCGMRPVASYSCPKCWTGKQYHEQGILECGVHEWPRKNYDDKADAEESSH